MTTGVSRALDLGQHHFTSFPVQGAPGLEDGTYDCANTRFRAYGLL